MRVVVLLVLAAVLTGCVSEDGGTSNKREWANLFAPLIPYAQTLEQARALVANRTMRGFSAGHGNQVEYTSANGTAHLWYPGNRVIVAGHWTVRPAQTMPEFGPIELCFKYGPNTYNPVTRLPGGDWKCQPIIFWMFGVNELVKGDPLGLRRNTIPFVMPKQKRLSLAELMAQAGRSGSVGPNLAVWRDGLSAQK